MKIELSVQKRFCNPSGDFTLSVDLNLNDGESVAVLGPSGSGKTTLLRILAGLTDPDTGWIRVNRQPWFDASSKFSLSPQKRKIGYVFQDYALFPNMTVLENIRISQPVTDFEYLQELMDMLGLLPFQKQRPHQLSGGQQQRVALARALARRPDIILLDEPLSALDSTMRQTIQEELLQIQRRWNVMSILVSHHLPEVFKLCNRVVVMENGRLKKEGSPHHVFEHHQLSGKVQFIAEVLHVQHEELVDILTVLVGSEPVKVAVGNRDQSFHSGDKVLIASKAFNPIIQKL